MIDFKALKAALLEYGMEDLIPLPELPSGLRNGEWRVRASVPEISEALTELLRAGEIDVWMAPAPADPEQVQGSEAERVITESDRYVWNSESDRLSRVYFSTRGYQ